MIVVVTDSNSQIPPDLAARLGIAVVPLPVTIDGVVHLEGVDLDADAFYARIAAGTPDVATAQPSPGQFADVYARLQAGGATAILSVHIGASVSGTVNSARLAARSVGVPVRIVDTGTASFAIALCAWAGAEAVAAGATLEQAAAAAEQAALAVGNVFVVGGLAPARAGGRLAAGGESSTGGLPVLSMVEGTMSVVGRAADAAEAAEVMAAHVQQAGAQAGVGLRVGVGFADTGVAHLADGLAGRLAGMAEVTEIVRYRVGPSVGVHTGPATVGAMYAPASVAVRPS